MKNLSITLTAAAMLAIFGCNNADKHNEAATVAPDTTTTTEKLEASVPTAPMDSAAMMKAWQEYMTPGDMHKLLASAEGKWDAEMRFWQSADAAPSEPSKSTVETKMALGGRYQVSEYKGTMMGVPFEGKETTAYDNAKKKFITTWIDNTGTGMMYMEGTYDAAAKSLNMAGKMIDPSTGQECDMRQVIKMVDDKTQVMEMYDTKGGKEYKSMEIKLTKK